MSGVCAVGNCSCQSTGCQGLHLMPTALSSSSADCAGLQSTDTTSPAPCSRRFSELQPPLVSVRHVSSLLIFKTCRYVVEMSLSQVHLAVMLAKQMGCGHLCSAEGRSDESSLHCWLGQMPDNCTVVTCGCHGRYGTSSAKVRQTCKCSIPPCRVEGLPKTGCRGRLEGSRAAPQPCFRPVL